MEFVKIARAVYRAMNKRLSCLFTMENSWEMISTSTDLIRNF